MPNCLLRIPPGQTDFDPDYYVEVPTLTGGLDSMTEMLSATMEDGIGFSMMMYPDRIPAGLDRVNFEHWDQPAYKMWRLELGDTPRAEEVTGAGTRTRVVAGEDPAALIVEAAEAEKADVLVVGNIGMSGRKEFLLGNVPNRVSHSARCTVVIVNTAEPPKRRRLWSRT